MNEIKEALEEATKKELAKRTKTHDEVERNAVKNLSEHYNVEIESGFSKEWEDLNGQYEDFCGGQEVGELRLDLPRIREAPAKETLVFRWSRAGEKE